MNGGELIFSLRHVLDSMVFGMSKVPGFSALSIPVFISNYLFDLFSEFFLVLTLFALAVMAFDGLRRGKQSLKEDAINLSLVIITVFLILQFKDRSVTYGNSSAYGIVTVYAGLLEKGEDMADALTYAILYNSPKEGKYSPGKKIPKGDTPLSGVVSNSFFSFIINKGKINNDVLNYYIKQREEIIKNQKYMVKTLFKQDNFNTVSKHAFDYARGAYVVMNANKKPQGYMYLPLSAVRYDEITQVERLYKKAALSGQLDKIKEIAYTITDGQTPSNECMFFKFVLPNRNGEAKAVDFRNIEHYINSLLSFKYFDKKTADCRSIPNQIEGADGLTYPYILKNELDSLAYFWGRIYTNLNNFKNSKTGKVIIGDKDELRKWNDALSIIKEIERFYKQAANLVKDNFPSNANTNGKYNLIFKPDANIDFGAIQKLREKLKGIWQEKRNIIKKFKTRGGEANPSFKEEDFFNSMNVLIQNYYVGAINAAYQSGKIFAPEYFLKGEWGISADMFPETFERAYNIASTTVVPYQAVALAIATKDKGANIVNFYNDLVTTLNKIYKKINENNLLINYNNIEQELKNKIKKGNVFKSNKGPSLNTLVLQEYGYNPKIDLIFPGKKIQENLSHKEIEQFLNNSKNAYKNKEITWVDLGYYFSAIKTYTSNFVIFNTFALANNAFSNSADISGKALKEAIEVAQQYSNTYNKNFSDAAKTRTIAESIANTMAFISAVKEVKDGLSISSFGGLAAGFAKGTIWGLIMALGFLIFKVIVLGAKVGMTFFFYLIAVTVVLKLVTILIPALFWMVAVINWFFKSAMMLIMLPINVFLLFFKSRRQVFFQALWKLLAQMLTPVALVATFFVIMVFSIEIDFLLSYFIPFLNDNVIVYFLSDDTIRHIINNIANNQYKEAESLIQNGHWMLASIQYIKTWFATSAAKVITWTASKTGLTSAIVKILGIILLIIKTLIVFIINLTLYMLFFRADDFIREVLGEIFGTATGFDSSVEKIMGKFGANKVT